MKKIFLLLFLCLPWIGRAQTDDKYLAGAVPVEDGKVSFKTEIQIPSVSKAQLYDTVLQWANQRFQPQEPFNARVLYADEDEGSIAVRGEEYIVFSSSAFSLDRSRIYYGLFITCGEGTCQVEMSRIRYLYDESRNGGERYTAEDWIVDDMALNKSKTKLAPICGKFRRKTIDLKEKLFKAIQDELSNLVLSKAQSAAVPTVTEETTATEGKSVVTLTPPVTAEVATPVETVSEPPVTETTAVETLPAAPETETTPVSEAQIAAATRMTITAGEGAAMQADKECWGGFGQLFGKDVTFCFIDAQETECNASLTQNDTYRIAFYAEGSDEPCAVIRCKKLMQQTLSGEEARKMNPNNDEGKSYNMYVGEIIR